MTLFHRRLLTILFLLIFLFIAPLLLLYAAGYRYNFSSRRLEKVGLLYVTSDTKDTMISVAGQEYKVGNELIIRSIRPGKYEVNAFADGYYSWKKTLEIEKGKSTFINDLTLFRDTPAEPFELFSNQLTLLKKTNSFTYYQNGAVLISYNLKSREILEIELNDEQTIETLVEGVKNGIVYLKQNDIWFKADLTAEQVSDISKFLPIDTNTLKETSSHLLALTDSGIFSISLTEILPKDSDTQEAQTDSVLAKPAPFISLPLPQEIIQSGKNFWLIRTEPSKKRSFLYLLEDGSSREHLITPLPYSDSYLIAEDLDGFLTIHDADNNILYLVDTAPEDANVATFAGVHTWQWSKDHSQLLTATEFELNIHHFDAGIDQELLVRLSTPITDTAWYTTESHVLYVSEDKLFLVERDQRDHINTFELTNQQNNLQLLTVDEDGYFVRFTADFGEEKPGFVFWQKELR